MRYFLAVCGAVLCLSAPAAAQDNSAPPAAPSPAPASAAPAPARYSGGEQFPWEVGVNFTYVWFRPTGGTGFGAPGFNTSATRFFSESFGLEGDIGATYGNTASPFGPLPLGNLRQKVIFYGGGLKFADRHLVRFEPFAHGLFGGVHARYTQTNGPGTVNAFAFMLGGGMDYKLGPRISWRVQGDFLGTRMFSTIQKNFQFQTGVIFSF